MSALAIVYVHLGDNPSPTLIPFARAAKEQLSAAELILITDKPRDWSEFPGNILNYNFYSRSQIFERFIKKNKEILHIARGYWLYTLERIFVLRCLEIGNTLPIVHFESDVYPFLNKEILRELKNRVETVAIPRFSMDRGIASVLYAKGYLELIKVIDNLEKLLLDNEKSTNDMELLGYALNHGLIEELPTMPEDAWEFKIQGVEKKLVFDGAALGQYLFGQDPFHTDGVRVSGYQNPDFNLQLSECFWDKNDNQGENFLLSFKFNVTPFVPAYLHIHSKEVIKSPKEDPARWIRAIKEANGEVSRLETFGVENEIHVLPIRLRDRFRLARKRGLIESTLKYLDRNILPKIKRR